MLLVSPRPDEARTLEAAMRAEGLEVARASTACDAAESLARGAVDAVVVCHPLPDADVIGACATLGQVPGAPPAIVVDELERREEIDRTVPRELRPARVLRRPLDAGKLPALVREVVEAADDAALVPQPGCDHLARVLGQVAEAGATGVLELHGDGVSTRIYFREGEVVSAEGGPLRETLGRMLLRRGDLSEQDYVRVIERMTEQIIENEQQRMGEVLVELGLMDSSQVYAALSSQVVEKVTGCFRRLVGVDQEFVEMGALPEGLEAFQVPPLQALVLEGLREHLPAETARRMLRGDSGRVPRLRGDPDEVARSFGLDVADRRRVGEIDGRRTLGELLDAGFSALLMAALLWTGALEMAEVKASSRPESAATHARPEFAREVVLPRRRKAPADPGPGAPAPAAPAEREAPVTTPDEGQRRLEAEQRFRHAQQLLSAEKFADALSVMERVVELQPLEPEYRMFEAWAAFLHARIEMRVARAKAAACARKASEADPRAAAPHSILGRIALEDGDHQRADKEFQAALVRNPEDADALRGLKLVRGEKA